jgi:carbonic anhydrase
MTNIVDPNRLLTRNIEWARQRVAQDPDYFSRLAAQQAPGYLWIGCSDSRVPANVITGLDPGEVFVHRNVANMIYASDINCMSVVQFAVETLKVRHIIVCGHYGCGGVVAAIDSEQYGLIDHWLEPIREMERTNKPYLETLKGPSDVVDRLCEINVVQQVSNLANSPILKRVWDKGQAVSIHGWIYSVADGLLRDLDCGQSAASV